jgi:hydrogenase maturation protein HypF
MNGSEPRAERIEITGIVQGVGFRPFVYNLAIQHHLDGYVLNSPDGVIVEIEGVSGDIEGFVHNLLHHAPPLSRIVEIIRKTVDTDTRNSTFKKRFQGFVIRESIHVGQPTTLIAPDICVCKECLSEFFEPHNRRYLYPFINCTNCGPRFTIIRDLPYDRPNTTMASFTMCPECHAEYADPLDRRFHAQPNACAICGPRLKILDSDGVSLPGDPVITAIDFLRKGYIVAVKGLGGFHLAVDGTSDEAVRRLRSRKHREEKPLALMAGSIESADRLVCLGKTEKQIIESGERPILLAPRLPNSPAAESVAPGNDHLGVMLPYTPLHYLIFFHPDAGGNYAGNKPLFQALVMTSGNLSEEPICKDNTEAVRRLSGIADVFLVHDRDIHVRSDDSVVRIADNDVSLIRRSRGYVPVPVFIKQEAPSVLALGAELKNTVCITEGRRAFTSQHIGDLENIVALDFFHEAVVHFKKILELEPWIMAYDLHPGYLSTKYFKNIIETLKHDEYGAVGVQHHHAHIASVLAEHGHGGPVIGFSMDGSGYGMDKTVWGGEILFCTPYGFSRIAHIDTVPMPGGESAVREPWRMACSYLWASYENEWRNLNLQCLNQIPRDDLHFMVRACERGINCPSTSSMGRLFDAVASILGICHVSAFEGQAAIMLDMLAGTETAGDILPYMFKPATPENFDGYPVLGGTLETIKLPHVPSCSEGFIIDYKPLIRALVEGIKNGFPPSVLARAFHETLLSSFVKILDRIAEITGIRDVAFSGGCWQNRILSVRFPEMLRSRGYRVLTNRLVPVNDGGISLGQAYIAANCALMAL